MACLPLELRAAAPVAAVRGALVARLHVGGGAVLERAARLGKVDALGLGVELKVRGKLRRGAGEAALDVDLEVVLAGWGGGADESKKQEARSKEAKKQRSKEAKKQRSKARRKKQRSKEERSKKEGKKQDTRKKETRKSKARK